MSTMSLALRLARRELRQGKRGFITFFLCLFLGVLTLATIGSLNNTLLTSLSQGGRALLGGDIALSLVQTSLTPTQEQYVKTHSQSLTHIITLRAMAKRPVIPLRATAKRLTPLAPPSSKPPLLNNTQSTQTTTLVDVKAVDKAYPLVGTLQTVEHTPLAQSLAQNKKGKWGLVVAPALLERLDLSLGSVLDIGKAQFVITNTIQLEPDSSPRFIQFGPRVFMSLKALKATQLIQPGSLTRHQYNLTLPQNTSLKQFKATLNKTFPNHRFRIQDRTNASPRTKGFINQTTLFLSFIGLAALLSGGIGISNATRAFLQSRTQTIAILKSLGASPSLIFKIYLLQILWISLLAIALALIGGALLPFFITPFVATIWTTTPLVIHIGFQPLLLAATYGILISLIFSLWPLASLEKIRPARLFRDGGDAGLYDVPSWTILAVILGLAAFMVGLILLTASNRLLTLWFLAGTGASFLLFWVVAFIVVLLAKKLPTPKNGTLRMAVSKLTQPHNPVASVLISLGLGLTLIATISQISTAIDRQITTTVDKETPAFFFMDIQPSQLAPFRALVTKWPTVSKMETVPMLRGRIIAIKGTSINKITIPKRWRWVVQSDRGVTWQRQAPTIGSKVVKGHWWPQNYSGPQPLISLGQEFAKAFHLKVGDTITVNVLGRDITAKIANLRAINWRNIAINFYMIFSPGLLDKAPQTNIATVYLDKSQETALEQKISRQFANVTALRTRPLLTQIHNLLGGITKIIQLAGLIAIMSGIFVLGGATAAQHRQSVKQAVILKVLGATNRQILSVSVLFYGLLGALAALIAAGLSTLGAFAVIKFILAGHWVFVWYIPIIVLVLTLMLTLSLGLIATWFILGQSPLKYLRNE